MKIFVCFVVLAVASCKAGSESELNNGLSSSSGADNSGDIHQPAQITGGDFSGGQIQDYGQGGGYGSLNLHGFSGQGSHGFSGGPSFDVGGGHGNDYTLAFANGQDFSGHGQQNFDGHGFGQQFAGDSYLQAAHDLGGQNYIADGGHSQEGNGGAIHEQAHGNGGGHVFSAEHVPLQGHSQQGFLLQDGGHEYGDQHNFGNIEAVPVGEHVDEEHPVEVPLYKHVTVPIHKTIHVNVPKPILVGIPHPYPVKVPVNKPVAVPVETEISIPIEKVVPYPVVKHVPYPVEKHVPIKIEKTVTVHVPQPYPVKIPVYKTIHHKGHD